MEEMGSGNKWQKQTKGPGAQERGDKGGECVLQLIAMTKGDQSLKEFHYKGAEKWLWVLPAEGGLCLPPMERSACWWRWRSCQQQVLSGLHLAGLGFCQVSTVEGRADQGAQGLDRDRL